MTSLLDRRYSTLKSGILGIFFLFFLSGKAFSSQEKVGSDGGSISVDNSGQAVWSMPIEVPNGINGVAPNLTLSISSSGGNGTLGVGGGLSGLSAITRCGKTIHQDGYFQSPSYTENDAYCLDGARLIKESGEYGTDGSIYRTEIETFQRVVAHGSNSGRGPAYFVVTNRIGATLIYGQNAGASEIDPATGAVSVWKIDQLIDSNSNTLSYHYEDVSGNEEHQLAKVTYGGNTNQNIAETVSVELLYDTRPDTSVVWSRGQQYHQTKRISNIQTKVGSTLVKDYRLEYEVGEVSGSSRIKSVQLCGLDGTDTDELRDCYRKSIFEYSPEVETAWQNSELSLPSAAQNGDGKPLGTLIDINNDGRIDWVSASRAADGTIILATYLGSDSGWQSSTEHELPNVLFDYGLNSEGFAKGVILDVNGDGWPEYVQAYQTDAGVVLKTWQNGETGFDEEPTPGLALPVALTRLLSDGTAQSVADIADLNADGLVDIVQSINTSQGSSLSTWVQTVTVGANGENIHSWPLSASYTAPSIGIDYEQGSGGRVLATLQDVNADGLTDWVQSHQINGLRSNATWLNTGQGFDSNVSSEFSLPDAVALYNYDIGDGVAQYTITDLNGDGLPDLSKAMTHNGLDSFDSWIHTGLTWQQDNNYDLPASVLLVGSNGNVASVGGLIDLNSDGQPDFVRSYSDATTTVEGYWVFNKSTRDWELTSNYDFPFVNNLVRADGTSFSAADVADLNHDGSPELLNTISGQVYEDNSSEAHSGILSRSINPLGAVTQLVYGMSTESALYELAEQSPYPNIAYNAPVRVVSTIATSNGIGGMISAHHSYGKAKTNVLGQGGLGYEYHALEDGSTGVQVFTQFHQTYPYAGRVKASSKSLGDTVFSLSNSEMEVHNISINGLTTLYPHPNSSVAETRDLNGTLLKITRSTSQIDGYGNTSNSVEEIFDATENLVRRNSTVVEFKAPDLSRWLFGLPKKSTQSLFDAQTGETYENESIATFFSDGKPKSETLEPDSGQWVTKTYEYDGFGNRTLSRVSAAGITGERKNTTSFTNNGRFPRTVKNTLGHTITTEFNPLHGKPNWVEDANGIKKEFYYDGFGGLELEQKQHQGVTPTESQQGAITKWCDSIGSNCPENAIYYITSINDDGESPESGYYNVNGKELRKQTFAFNPDENADLNNNLIVVDTEYNHNGQVVRVTQPYFMYVDSMLPHDSNIPETIYEYDVLGRETKRINVEGDTFTSTYNGFEVSTTNPGNSDSPPQTTKIISNIFGQPIRSTDPDQNSVFYAYDGRGKLVKTTDAKGNFAIISYDPVFGRKIAMDDPDLGAWSYQYDSLGNLISQTDANGQITRMEYDVLNRLVRRVDDEGGDKQGVTVWEYSEIQTNQNTLGDLIGGLKRVTSPDYERTVKYDELGRIAEANSVIDGQSFTQRTGYLGTEDKVDWIEYPSGLSVRNTYDGYGFPRTVEGIELDYDKYREYQAASRELNSLRRDLEAYKANHLSNEQLFQLEENEREVRRLGGALSEFYDDFNSDPTKEQHESEALQYSGDEDTGADGLILRVQKKIEQHGNGLNIYQRQRKTLVDKIKPDIDRLEEISGEQQPHIDQFNLLKPSYDHHNREEARYLGYANSWAAKVNTENTNMNNAANNKNANINTMNNQWTHVKNLVRSLYKEPYASNYINGDITRIFSDFECCTQHVINNFTKTTNPNLIEQHLTDIGNYLNNYAAAAERAAAAQDKYDEAQGRRDYNQGQMNHYVWRAGNEASAADGYASRLDTEANEIERLSNEAESIDNDIAADINKINEWLTPIVISHSNVMKSYVDRARLYLNEISKRTGSYAKRDDLKAEKFLKPFADHKAYVQCLNGNASSGTCYANNLVHVVKSDGNVDATKQATEREAIPADYRIDIRQFYSDNRFFCPYYYGYNCSSKYNNEFKQITKAIHIAQCNKMTTKEKASSSVPCERSKWNETYTSSVDGNNYPKYRYLLTSVTEGYPAVPELSNSQLNTLYNNLVVSHKAEVERLVFNATANTYNEESSYSKIIQLGGALWQASRPVTLAEGDTDPGEFVLLYKGSVQRLAYNQMNTQEREAERELKDHQRAIALLIGEGQSGAYDAKYLAVQEKAEEVERLYKEVDHAYATASDDDEFDDNEFDEAKKVYWRAEEVNAKGQIAKAKYGNNTVTSWGYDEFGRINGHVTKNANNQVLVNNSYSYDAIGNLTQRADYVEQVTENFTYDNLNRLVQSNLSGSGAALVAQVQGNVVNYEYDELGNLTYKSDIKGGGGFGRYSYGAGQSGPHAVSGISGLGSFTYDNNGNQLSGNGRAITYSAFNKPTSILKGANQTDLWYGPERQMIKQSETTPEGLETTLYVGGQFEQISSMGKMVYRHHVSVAGHAIAVVETEPGSLVATKESYLHKNHQSSVLAISDMDGQVAERRYYDAFGDIKSYIGQSNQRYSTGLNYASITDVGFTSHRSLVGAGLIHMGGRVYDAMVGRFLSADPHIQSPLNSQSLNRYSYTLNNPLSWTDPSGYFFKSLFKGLKKLFQAIGKIIKKVLAVVKKVIRTVAKVIKKIGKFIKKYYKVIAAVVVSVAAVYFGQTWLANSAWSWATTTTAAGVKGVSIAGAAALGATAGGLSGLIATGSLRGALKGAVFGAVTAGFARYVNLSAASKINNLGTGVLKQSVKTGLANSIRTAANIKLVIGHALIGGVRAAVNGGKFLTGALTGGVGKLVTFGITKINSGLRDPFVQGLVVATAGGVVASLAGGSFELGFLTAGLAFASNELIQRMNGFTFDTKRRATREAARSSKARSRAGNGNLNLGVNIYKDEQGKFHISEPHLNIALRSERVANDGERVGWFGDREMPNLELVGIHVYVPDASDLAWMGNRLNNIGQLIDTFDVDLTVETSHELLGGSALLICPAPDCDGWNYVED